MPDTKDAFISYGRQPSQELASRLYKRLEREGFGAWYDFVNIPKGEDFQERIYSGIESAHNFIFIISPHANKSEYCLKEINHALLSNKRIIPILHIEDELDTIHSEIAKLNWVYARETINEHGTTEAKDSFETAFLEVVEVIKTEKAYTEQHTQLLKRAIIWNKNQRAVEFLITGSERRNAEKWLLTNIHKPHLLPCLPTNLHSEFICESRKNAENLMTDTFISYADEDKDIHEQVRKFLTRYLITSWAHYLDIKKGEEFDAAILDGIEKANNVLYFISEKSVRSLYCHKELAHAKKYNKRIIPLLIEDVPESDFPEQIKGLQFIDFTDNVKTKDYLKDIGSLVKELNDEKSYHEQHKIILYQALKWQRQNRNASILLRGYNLQSAIAFLKTGERKKYTPTSLQKEFIEESKSKTAQINPEVFISYSRTDSDFARKLNDELQLSGKTTWFDQESIAAAAADFQEEIFKGIAASDNFLFIISEKAVTSEHCASEVAHALKSGKRFITILLSKPQSSMHEALARINWINFKENDFHFAFGELLRTLDTDRNHVIQHSKWGQRALEWESKKKSKDLLLRGNECLLAESWLQKALLENKVPTPTQTQKSFIETSIAVEKKEQKRKASLIQRLRIYLLLAVVAFISTMIFGIYALHLKDIADIERDRAIKSEQETIQREKEVLAAKEELDSLYFVLSVINIKYEELLAITDQQQVEIMEIEVMEEEKRKLSNEIKKLQEGININQLEKTELASVDKIDNSKVSDNEATLEKDRSPTKPKVAGSRSLSFEDTTGSIVDARNEPVFKEIQENESIKERIPRKTIGSQVTKRLQEAKNEVKQAFATAENTYLVTAVNGNPTYKNGKLIKKGDRIKDNSELVFDKPTDVLQLVSPKGRFICNKKGLYPARKTTLENAKQ